MENCISFTKTVASGIKKFSDPKYWDNAKKYFDEGNYTNAFYATLNYIDEDLINKYGNANKTEFTFPQGSAVVIVKIEDSQVKITAPFVKIPNTKFLPIFRKCTELNFKVMTLPQIVIKDNYLIFQYTMPLDLCEPYKLYDVLRDIAQNADKYDDEFVEKFGAERIMQPMISNYDNSQIADILANCKAIAKEALSHIEYFESKRRMGNACDALFVGLKRIDYYCEPSGMMYKKLDDSLSEMFNGNNDWVGKLKIGKQFLASIDKISQEELQQDVFVGFSLMPLKRNASRNFLEEFIENHLNEAISLHNNADYISSTYYSLYTLYSILANYNLEENSKNAIEYSLKKAAGQPWEEASDTLLEVMDFFYQNNEEVFDMEEDNSQAPAFDMSAISGQMGDFMKNYQNMLGGFLQSFNK